METAELNVRFDRIEKHLEKIETDINYLKSADERVKSEMIKWSFIFWIGQFAIVLSLFAWQFHVVLTLTGKP